MKNPRSEILRLVPGYLPFTINADQQNALESLAEFVTTAEDNAVFILRGYAGTGKTSLISAFAHALPSIRWRSVLLAPTGRAAKVLGNYARRPAVTIHKKIYRKATGHDGGVMFVPAENLHRNTLFIVDEASMIGGATDTAEGSRINLLEDLLSYVYSGQNCRLLLMGDTAQLPPVGSEISPAIDPDFLRRAYHFTVTMCELKEVARQRLDSGILFNATRLRIAMLESPFVFPPLEPRADFTRLDGQSLEDELNGSVSRYGEENVIIITRSNKRAGLFNRSYRNRIRFFDDDLCTGDRLMVVKNNYFWLGESADAPFIANGDMAEITRIVSRETTYGFGFCECALHFTDNQLETDVQVKIITDCLYSDEPALTSDQQKQLYANVLADVENEPSRTARMAYVRKSPYYNALQVKFAYAVTCHKSQGGQWPVVFIDQGFLPSGTDLAYARWLYTAITRATERVYLVNFGDEMFEAT